MAWTVPLTAVSNATLTAAQWNATVRDNLLETGPAKATAAGRFFATTAANTIAERIPSTATVTTAQTTTSTTYTNLATAGPSVTVATGPVALVSVGAVMSVSTGGTRFLTSFDVSGATTRAELDAEAAGQDSSNTDRILTCSRVSLVTGLTAGNNTFRQRYRVSGDTGTFSSRNIIVIPF